IAVLAGHAVMLRIDRREWSSVGLGRDALQPRLLLRGAILGALAIGVPSLLLLGAGWLALRSAPSGSWVLAALGVSAILVPAAFAEEVLSRGYLFATLREWLGPVAALAITSAGLGPRHLGHPG